jgi:hypothetical protein
MRARSRPHHTLLVRRHLKTGELASHYCFVPERQLAAKARLISGLRPPITELSARLLRWIFFFSQARRTR